MRQSDRQGRAYPLLPLGCAAATWRALGRGEWRRALWCSAAPLLLAVPLLAWFWYVSRPV